jgi:hypothetical protein
MSAALVLAEPDVALTDWALAVEAFVLAWLARSHGAAWVLFFGSIGVAGVLGGVSHGFFPDGGGLVATALWRATLLCLGLTAAAAAVAGSRALDGGLAVPARRLAAVLSSVYTIVVLAFNDAFAVAVIAYLPATLFLLGVFVVAARRARGGGAALAACGVTVLLLGTWVQWRTIGAPALGLTHNALFHVIQMLALPLIYQGAGERRAREA